jgi:hypothetical protein
MSRYFSKPWKVEFFLQFTVEYLKTLDLYAAIKSGTVLYSVTSFTFSLIFSQNMYLFLCSKERVSFKFTYWNEEECIWSALRFLCAIILKSKLHSKHFAHSCWRHVDAMLKSYKDLSEILRSNFTWFYNILTWDERKILTFVLWLFWSTKTRVKQHKEEP